MRYHKGYSPRIWMHKFATFAYASLFLLDLAIVVLILSLYFAMGSEQQHFPSDENHIIKVIVNVSLLNEINE
jgi:hypothetical protein